MASFRKTKLKAALLILALLALYYNYSFLQYVQHNLIEKKVKKSIIEETLKYDKGTGCNIPQLDPFAPEVMKFVVKTPKIVCGGLDWVKCYLSTCKVVPEILNKLRDIVCVYGDILFKPNDRATRKKVYGGQPFSLKNSDHVLIECRGAEPNSSLVFSWSGYGTGLRPVTPTPAPPGREHTYNILLFGFDSTSKNGFIRKMPKSYKFLKEQVKPVILNGYNIVGSGTIMALTPILTGKTYRELPEVRHYKSKNTVDQFPFIFYKLKKDGYRTAYFEDSPRIETFTFRFNGWKKQPTDHYLKPLMLDKYLFRDRKRNSNIEEKFCIGDTPSYKVMMNSTEQFMLLPGKKFILNLIGDISHDKFNFIESADEDLVLFLRNFMRSGLKENTLLVVMGDHGQKFGGIRTILQGRLEERLPLMAIRLPDRLVAERPDALTSLKHNAEVLTTPHDLHATLLDVVNMRRFWNPYRITGADLSRALTMLEPIPSSRSCSEAGVEPHWCTCLSWKSVSSTDPLYEDTANRVMEFINNQTEPKRSKCAYRTLRSIEWIKVKEEAKSIRAGAPSDLTGMSSKTTHTPKFIQIKLTAAPGMASYEATITDFGSAPAITVSRVNAYGNEPDCVSATHKHLNPYCYCYY